MKKGFIHHPPIMSFYMQTQFRVQASQMGCLWKRQRLSSNHSLLCDCTAGLERKRGWCWMEGGRKEGGRESGWICWRGGWPACSWGPLLRATVQPQSTCGASAGSMLALYHIVAQTNVLPLKCRQQSWCELCMYTNELYCRMLSWWLPSLLGIDPSRVKTGRKTGGRRPATTAIYPGITPGSSRSFHKYSLKLWSPPWSFIWITSTYLLFFPLLLASDECKSQHGNGIIHSWFCSGSFGSCL